MSSDTGTGTASQNSTSTGGESAKENGSTANGSNNSSTFSKSKKKYKNKYKNKKQEKVFKGNTREMNGHMFETYYECKDETQFKKTLDMLGQYVNKYLKYPDDMEPVYTHMEEPEKKKRILEK